jgi:O-antigen ligase
VLGSIVGLTLILGGIVYIASSEHVSRIENAVSAARAGDISQADSSLEHRKNFIVLAAKQTAQHPILGVGLDNFRDIGVGFFRSIGTYSHSNYMEVMVSTGIPGLLLYCAMYVTVIVKCFAARTYYLGGDRVRLFAICAAIVLIVVVFDFAMVSYYEKPIWLLLAVIFGQLELLRRNPDSLTSNQI